VYYAVAEDNGQIMEFYDHNPSTSELLHLAAIHQVDLYLIEGERAGVTVKHKPRDAHQVPAQQAQGG